MERMKKVSFTDWNIWHSLLLARSKRVSGAWQMIEFGAEGDHSFYSRGKSVLRIV